MDRLEDTCARSRALTARIVGAYVRGNPAGAAELPSLIRQVHQALAGVDEPAAAAMVAPAVPIDRSIHKGFLICLEDGRKFRSLKRHLRTVYSLTPEAYRAKWGLPADYPMVAPSYSANRSALAKAIGLGAMGPRSGVVLWQAGAEVRVA
jgi:predicted transcriptional regulator